VQCNKSAQGHIENLSCGAPKAAAIAASFIQFAVVLLSEFCVSLLMAQKPTPITRAKAQEKADECRALLSVAVTDSQRIMLTHIAETWERIASRMDETN
jgi:hypothetical protein